MGRKTAFVSKPLVIVLFLTIAMCAIGVAYAFWSGVLNINTNVKTGSFNLTFNPDHPVSAGILDISNGDFIYETTDISFYFDNISNKASLSIPSPLLTDDLAFPGRALVFMYPLDFDETSTVTSIECFEQDLSLPSDEQLELSPNGTTFSINGFDYDISSLMPDFCEAPLYFDVYRRISTENGQIVGTVFLVMTPETAEYLTKDTNYVYLNEPDLPLELSFLYDEPDCLADITVNYSFTLPLYVEQGR